MLQRLGIEVGEFSTGKGTMRELEPSKHLPSRGIFAALLVGLGAAGSPQARAGEPEWFTAIKAAYAAKVKAPKDQPPMPPVNARIPGAEYGYGEWKYAWNGVGIVWDDVNGEALFLCGHNGGMPSGTMGSWALTDGGKTWRELQWTSPLLDPLREQALAARQPAKDGEAAARGIFYAALDAEKEAAAVKGTPAKLIGEAARLAEELAAKLRAATASGGEKEAIARAAARTADAVAALKSAHAAVAATFQSPLELWRQAHFGVTQATGNAANLADPDGDGVPNLVEYALGSLPTSAGSLPGHRHTVINERLTLTFNRVRSDVTYLVEASSDLAAWAVIATNPGTVSPSVPVTVELSTATPHCFLRLRITAP